MFWIAIADQNICEELFRRMEPASPKNGGDKGDKSSPVDLLWEGKSLKALKHRVGFLTCIGMTPR
jgi:hypothetical protein